MSLLVGPRRALLSRPAAAAAGAPAVGLAPDDASIAANLKLWLKADVIAQADSTAVASWSDSSGNAHAFAQATGTNQPTYRSNLANGHAGVRCVTDDYMTATASADFAYPTTNTWIVVARINDGDMVLFEDYNGSAGVQVAFGPSSSAGNRIANFFLGANGSRTSTGALTSGAYNVFSCVTSGSAVNHFLNGAANGALAGISAPNQGTTLTLARSAVGANRYLDGDLLEVCYYNTNLSTTARHNVELNLGAKYGVTVA